MPDAFLPRMEYVSMPSGSGDRLRDLTKVNPEILHGSQFFIRRHLLKGQNELHGVILLQ
jgi:hypothetical protein